MKKEVATDGSVNTIIVASCVCGGRCCLAKASCLDGTPSIPLVYDVMGRRTAITRSGSMMSETRTDCYGYNDRNELVSETTEPVATRPLVLQRQGGWNFFYTHDGNKNVSDVVSFQQARGVPAHYEYAPFGAVTAATTNTAFTAFNVVETNPYRFSSEYSDDTLGLVYYNYRHYNPMDGRWLRRDPSEEYDFLELYVFVGNNPLPTFDSLGMACEKIGEPYSVETKIEPLGRPVIKTRYSLLDARPVTVGGAPLGLPTGYIVIEKVTCECTIKAIDYELSKVRILNHMKQRVRCEFGDCRNKIVATLEEDLGWREYINYKKRLLGDVILNANVMPYGADGGDCQTPCRFYISNLNRN